MRIKLRWFLTGKVTPLVDNDEILNPKTTMAEVKGLIHIRFGFEANEVLLIKEHLLENNITLESIGILGKTTDPTLVAHVIRASELEASNLNVDDTSNDDRLQEFSHADFILAMKMLGKPVAVSDERLVAMRENAPRRRPTFLDASPSLKAANIKDNINNKHIASSPSTSNISKPSIPGVSDMSNISIYDPSRTQVMQILTEMRYGLRREDVDREFAVPYPGMEPCPFWDMRPPNTAELDSLPACQPGEVCLELFYFAEYKRISNKDKFNVLLQNVLESKAGIRLRIPFHPREAGCMYPLVACAIIVHEMDAMELGNIFFEDFGKAPSALGHNSNNSNNNKSNQHNTYYTNMSNDIGNKYNEVDDYDSKVAGDGGCSSQ